MAAFFGWAFELLAEGFLAGDAFLFGVFLAGDFALLALDLVGEALLALFGLALALDFGDAGGLAGEAGLTGELALVLSCLTGGDDCLAFFLGELVAFLAGAVFFGEAFLGEAGFLAGAAFLTPAAFLAGAAFFAGAFLVPFDAALAAIFVVNFELRWWLLR